MEKHELSWLKPRLKMVGAALPAASGATSSMLPDEVGRSLTALRKLERLIQPPSGAALF